MKNKTVSKPDQNIIKVGTYLPVFPGFYGTIFESSDEDQEIDNYNYERGLKKLSELEYDQFEFDYHEYRQGVAQSCTDFIEENLKNLNVVTSIKFEKVVSPREYNFRNDSIDIQVELSQENIVNIKKIITDNIDKFEVYIHDQFTSYDGFISFYDNNYENWLNEIDDAIQYRTKLGVLLEFICRLDDDEIDDENMYYYSRENGENYLELINYDDVMNREYCQVCKSFVDVEDFRGNCCADCYDADNVQNLDHIICNHCREEITNAWEKRSLSFHILHHDMKFSKILCTDCQALLDKN